MDKKRIVLEVLGSGIEEFGFSYDTDSSDKITWNFQREKESIKQIIMILEHRYAKILMLRFTTSKLRAKVIDAVDIIPDDIYDNNHLGWKYNDEKEFRNCLLQFIGIIRNYGLEVLDGLSSEETIEPTYEMGEKLLTLYESLSKKFAKENKLSTELSKENILQWFNIIGKKLEETKDMPYSQVQDMLVEIAAFLGEQIRSEVGGEWEKGVDSRVTMIININSYIQDGYLPLVSVIDVWKTQKIEMLKQEFLFIIDGKLPLTEEEMTALQKRRQDYLINQ